MLFQLFKRNPGSDRHAVADHVQVGFPEIYDSLPLRILYAGISYVPLSGNIPVEYGCPAGDLVDCERNPALKDTKGLSHSAARDASANGI